MDQGLKNSCPVNLRPHAVREGLETRWLGKQPIYCFDEVESTNSEAKRLARQGAQEGTVVLAEAQSMGRGRLRRLWISPHGKGLYLSVILRPQVPPEWCPRITLTAGVALAEAVHEIGIVPGLKWPNDMMIGDRKVAGILTEATFEDKSIGFVILGVGINVNTHTLDFPVSIRNLATSLSLSMGEAISRVTLLQTFLCKLEQWYELFCQGSFEKILDVWHKYEAVLGRPVEVNLPDSRLVGVAERIDSDGSLMVRDKAGRLHRIIAGDIIYFRVQ